MYNIAKIREWHTATFPNATIEGQLKKYMEEYKEFMCATTKEHKTEELADMYIVACGISRFSTTRAEYCYSEIFSLGKGAGITMGAFVDAVSKKMNINKARKWEGKDGCYRHCETKPEITKRNLLKEMLSRRTKDNFKSYQKSDKDADLRATIMLYCVKKNN